MLTKGTVFKFCLLGAVPVTAFDPPTRTIEEEKLCDVDTRDSFEILPYDPVLS